MHFVSFNVTLHTKLHIALMEQTFDSSIAPMSEQVNSSASSNIEEELIAKTFMGLEPVLAKELTQLGANNVQIGRRMVSFTGNKELLYRANF